MASLRRSERIRQHTEKARMSQNETPAAVRERCLTNATSGDPVVVKIPTSSIRSGSDERPADGESAPRALDQESGNIEMGSPLTSRKKQRLSSASIYPPGGESALVRPNEALRLATWNVSSLRSAVRDGSFSAYLQSERPDILCVQETKMTPDAVVSVGDFSGYDVHWNHSERRGYSGVATFIRQDLERLKVRVERVECGCVEDVADSEGRVLTVLLTNDVAIVNAYVPNSGRKLERLQYRTTKFEPAMAQYLNGLNKEWNVVYTGDLNVAHMAIDIHNSRGNQKSAGHTLQERTAFDDLLASGRGWVDAWRQIHQGYSGYTYYSRRFGDRLKKEGKGWRLDYFVVDEKSFQAGIVLNVVVRADVSGSDHYPVVMDLCMRKRSKPRD